MPEATEASAVLEARGPRRRPHRAARQRRAGGAARRHRGRRRRARAVSGCTRCTRCTTGRTCTARSATGCATCRTSCPTSRGPASAPGTIDLVPNNFSEMRDILARRTTDPLVLAAASPPDRHGYFSLGLNADYVASFIGRAPVLPRGQRADAAHVRTQPDPHQPGRRLDRGRPPARRGAAARRGPRSTTASPPSSPSGSPTGRRSRPASARSPTPSCRR